jgi:uncharacterized membrane protein
MIKKIVAAIALLLFLVPVVSAYNLRVTSTDYAKTIYPCKPVSFGFTIQNTGLFTETYYLMVDNFQDYTTFSQNPIKIAPGYGQQAFAFVSPSCDINGNFNFNIVIRALNSGQQITLPVQLNIIEYYDYSLSYGDYYVENEPIEGSDGNYKICEEDTKQIPILIQNNADVLNSYRIALNGTKFAEISQKSAVLEGRQKGVVFINLEPKMGDKGKYSLITYSNSERGSIRKAEKAIVEVEDCYDVEVNLPKEAVISDCEQSSYEFSIENKGKYEEAFELVLESPDWVSLDYNFNNIGANAQASAFLKFNVPCGKEGKYKISVIGVSKEHENIQDRKYMSITLVPQYKFYNTLINAPNKQGIRYWTKEMPFKVTNNGLKEISYSLSLTAPSWVDVEPKTFTLNPKETTNAKLIFSPNQDVEENHYAMSINASTGGALYSKNMVIQLKEKYISDHLYIFFSGVWKWIVYYVYYIIAIPILLAILIPSGIFVKRFLVNRKEKVKAFGKFLYMIVAPLIMLGGAIYFVAQYAVRKFSTGFELTEVKEHVFGFFSSYVWYIVTGFIILAVTLGALAIKEKRLSSSKKSKKNKPKKKRSKKKRK